MDEVIASAGEPLTWILIFRPWSESRLIRLVPGRFKHVSACCYLAAHKLWITYDVGFSGTKLMILPDGAETDAILSGWFEGCELVRVRKNPDAPCRLPLLGWCVPSMARLVGLRSGALRPDRLYRQCLANGGTIIGRTCQGATVPGATAD